MCINWETADAFTGSPWLITICSVTFSNYDGAKWSDTLSKFSILQCSAVMWQKCGRLALPWECLKFSPLQGGRPQLARPAFHLRNIVRTGTRLNSNGESQYCSYWARQSHGCHTTQIVDLIVVLNWELPVYLSSTWIVWLGWETPFAQVPMNSLGSEFDPLGLD